MPQPAPNPAQPSLKSRALRLLAQREHSRVELERKLAEHEQEPGQLARVLAELTARGYISDERVAQSLMHRRAGKLGTARVVQELRAKGVDAAVVSETAAQLRASEWERAQAVWQRKFGSLATSAQEQARQMRFLAARGFAPELIRKVVQGQPPPT